MGGLAATCLLLAICLAAHPALAADAVVPSRDGLRLWLDASDAATVSAGADGAVGEWRDKSPARRRLIAEGRPVLVADAMNGLPVVRLGEGTGFAVGDLRPEPGPYTVFAVTRRTEDQATEQTWQRIVSSWNGSEVPDHKPPNFAVTAGESGAPFDARVTYETGAGAVMMNLTVGRSALGGWANFRGDLAELLVYDRGFLSEAAIMDVMDYLAGKWGAEVARKDLGWTRVGELGPTPERVNDEFPLSDQANEAGWVPLKPMWDEFGGDALDDARWVPWHHYWKGRQPAFFWTENVEVHDGALRLTMRKEEAPDQPHDRGYRDYTSACVSSRATAKYGYFEIRARPMRSAGSSAFWFQTNKGEVTTEIDVFEIGGRAPGYERKYNMNLHVNDRREGQKDKWSRGGAWTAPWDLDADYHVYGLEWDKESLKYYVDGVVVRTTPNTDWHQELYLYFDSETMPNWFGMPRDEDLPSTYTIGYVRAWTKAEARD